MKQTTWKSSLLICFGTIGLSLLFAGIVWADKGLQTWMSNGLLLAGILLSCTWALKYVRLIGGVYGSEVEAQLERQKIAQDRAITVQNGAGSQVSNLYRYKMGPKVAQPIIHIGLGLLCILISALLVL